MKDTKDIINVKHKSKVGIDDLFEDDTKEEKKSTNTAFYLMFPSLISAAVAVYYAPLLVGLITLALAIYQFLMLKSFIQDFYNK